MKNKFNNFISFEGVDGSGKSTQIKLLSALLTKNNIENCILREPGGTELSEQIRKILLDTNNSINKEEETLLFLAARANLVKEFILPKLNDNIVVLCDRYIDSTMAYQAYGRELNVSLINEMNKFATNNTFPILTIIFDLNPDIIKERLKNKTLDRMEVAGDDFQHKVRQGYLDISKENERYHVINCANKSIHQIHVEVVDVVSLYIERIKNEK